MSNDGKYYIDSHILLNGYAHGIFPMADGEHGSISWYNPERRGIIPLDGLRVSRSLRRIVRNAEFSVTHNRAFEDVIRSCAARNDIWISETIIESYLRLYALGYAHSFECWKGDSLAGGLYGVTLGGAFFGESMFSRYADASKVALVHLVRKLNECRFLLLDTQYQTPHLATLGCIEISREEYQSRLQTAISQSRTLI